MSTDCCYAGIFRINVTDENQNKIQCLTILQEEENLEKEKNLEGEGNFMPQ